MKRNVAIGTGACWRCWSRSASRRRLLQQTADAQAKGGTQAPRFEVDPMWPKPLPNHWICGNVIGVGVDTKDNVYIIHRGAGSLEAKEIYATTNPPSSDCCVPAPPVVEFDAAGNFVRAWGGPGQGYEWPDSNHGITPDSKGNVFIGGNGPNDGQVLKFTQDGKFVKQFGFAYAGAGSNDMWAFKQVAKISLDETANEAYVSDGYGNHRVAVIDMDTRQDQALLGRLRQQAGRHQSRPLQSDRAGRAAVPQPGALRRAVERRHGLRLRPRQRSHPGVHEGRQVREGSVRREEHARRRRRVGHRVLEGRRAEVLLPGRRREREGPRVRSRSR